MNNELYDVRVGVKYVSEVIREWVIDQATWREMVIGTGCLFVLFHEEPACRENPYLYELLLNAVGCVLYETKDFVSDSGRDRERELALVKSTKSALEQVISDKQDEVDICYPECPKCAGECRC